MDDLSPTEKLTVFKDLVAAYRAGFAALLDKETPPQKKKKQMSDLSLMAATEWAQQNKGMYHDPVVFGSKVAQVYLACETTRYTSGGSLSPSASLQDVRDGIMRAAGFGPKQSPKDDAEPQPSTEGRPKTPSSPNSGACALPAHPRTDTQPPSDS